MLPLFETRTMLDALEQSYPPKLFLRDTFFTRVETFQTEHIDIDVRKGKRRVAPYVHPRAEGKVVERIGFKTHTYKPPYIKEKMPTTAQDFLTRNIGETVYGANDGPQQRAEKQLGKDLADMQDMILRREETQASELLQTGKVTIVGDGIDDVIDFVIESSHLPVLAGSDLWSHADSDPLKDLRHWKRLVVQDSGIVPTIAIFGADVIDAFIKNAKVQNVLDNRRIVMGQIDPNMLPNGVTYYGNVKDVGLDIYTYDEWYVDPTTTVEMPMIGPKKVVMGSPQARTYRNYGAIQDLKATFAVPMFPKSWETEDPSVRWLLLQSAPLLSLNQVDAFLCATVLT